MSDEWRREEYTGFYVLRRRDRYGFDRRVSVDPARDGAGSERVPITFYSPGRDCEDQEDVPCEVLAAALRVRGWTVAPPPVGCSGAPDCNCIACAIERGRDDA